MSNTCKICGEKIDNKGLFLAHMKKHKENGEKLKDISEEMAVPLEMTIPFDLCPDEIKFVREGGFVALKILCRKGKDGAEFKKEDIMFVR